MKKSFFSFYAPTNEQYERLWKEGLIVLDTNVLLDLYRLPATARDELLAVLDKLKERLWIPHQVGLEFQRRRLTVMSAGSKSTEETLKAATGLVDQLKSKVDELQIDKYGLGVDSKALISDLDQANQKLTDAIKAVHESKLKIAATDPIREKIDDIFFERVGAAPTNQKELDEFMRDGEERFANKIPPGFADSEKDKNPNETTFIFDNLKYQRKFGDLILWRQLIAHMKARQIKVVLFVTGDKKEDWWWRENGKTIGPHPELAQEIVRESAVELFWMYLPEQFLRHAKQYVQADVSEQAVQEVEQVNPGSKYAYRILENWKRSVFPRRSGKDIFEWLRHRFGEVRTNPIGFPDFLRYEGEEVCGYTVEYISLAGNFASRIMSSAENGYRELRDKTLKEFVLILVVDNDEFLNPNFLDSFLDLRKQSKELIERYPITKIMAWALSELGQTTLFEISPYD